MEKRSGGKKGVERGSGGRMGGLDINCSPEPLLCLCKQGNCQGRNKGEIDEFSMLLTQIIILIEMIKCLRILFLWPCIPVLYTF